MIVAITIGLLDHTFGLTGITAVRELAIVTSQLIAVFIVIVRQHAIVSSKASAVLVTAGAVLTAGAKLALVVETMQSTACRGKGGSQHVLIGAVGALGRGTRRGRRLGATVLHEDRGEHREWREGWVCCSPSYDRRQWGGGSSVLLSDFFLM